MDKNYARIDYNPNDPDDVTLSEVTEQKIGQDEYFAAIEKGEEEIRTEEVAKILRDSDRKNEDVSLPNSSECIGDNLNEIDLTDSKTMGESMEASNTGTSGSSLAEDYVSDYTESADEICEAMQEEEFSNMQEYLEIKKLLLNYDEELKLINQKMLRLEKKFSDEILNSESRDNTVKTMYKELNDYKAGLIEKALKNVLYDIVDIREMMLSQIRYLREKKGEEVVALDELESYASDLGDILEKHDVIIYKGEPGEENIAVRQKIVKKVETEDEGLVKKVAESLSYGYEYNTKILYPEKISIYVRKK